MEEKARVRASLRLAAILLNTEKSRRFLLTSSRRNFVHALSRLIGPWPGPSQTCFAQPPFLSGIKAAPGTYATSIGTVTNGTRKITVTARARHEETARRARGAFGAVRWTGVFFAYFAREQMVGTVHAISLHPECFTDFTRPQAHILVARDQRVAAISHLEVAHLEPRGTPLACCADARHSLFSSDHSFFSSEKKQTQERCPSTFYGP